MLTARDIQVIASLAHYYTLTRAQITRLHFPEDDDGRMTRKRLALMLSAGMIHRTAMQVVNPSQGMPAPVYYPSKNGCAFLAQETGDERYRTACTNSPNWQHLYHWVQVAETHLILDQSAACDGTVRVVEWFGEWSVVNPDERIPEKRYRLYTRLSDQLVCVPDAAFLLEKSGHRKAFYLEQDRDTTKNAERVAGKKHLGYAVVAERHGHKQHFPDASAPGFMVLMIAPSVERRDALKTAMASKPGAHLWKFATALDLNPESFLNHPVWHGCDGSCGPLIRQEGSRA